MFDLFDRNSFNNLDNWLKEVDNHAKPNIQVIVIANKYDMVEMANEMQPGENTEKNTSTPDKDLP